MNDIQVGGLVRVARGMSCCGHETGAEGMVFVVTNILLGFEFNLCDYCNASDPESAADGCPNRRPIDISRLRKIPPLSELEKSQEQTPVTFDLTS